MNYKDTLNIFQTDFSMKAKLPFLEPKLQEKWNKENLYFKILEKNKNSKEKFYLHDGPPYANGNIHVGHALNKIIKDIIVKSKNMQGIYSPITPGWDTHGLPIENKILQNKKINAKELSDSEFRKVCEEYAREQVKNQKDQFKKLGIIMDFENPYLTLDKNYEANQIRIFAKMIEKNIIYKDLKPVYWSWSSKSALAEAEIEYQEKLSPSAFIAFKVKKENSLIKNNEKVIIWTTTPWTIPANVAVTLNKDFLYTKIKYQNENYFVEKTLLKSFVDKLNWEEYEIIKDYKATNFKDLVLENPWNKNDSVILFGDHVTNESGTGFVHTAPAHGEDDFLVCKKNNIKFDSLIEDNGCFNEKEKTLEGVFYDKANKIITEKLKEENSLLHLEFIKHSYPHDWRTKKPVIFRATFQWFASIDLIKKNILNEIENINFINEWGKKRIFNMINNRSDWCISRQRKWGVPITIFYDKEDKPILDEKLINHVANLFQEHGSNIWYEWDIEKLVPDEYKLIVKSKENDIMDVWFDSGTSFQSVLKDKEQVTQADLYFEGSDQYRGWFNSSLINGVSMNEKTPYKNLLSHGFVLDAKGNKMSKSLGNTADPLKIINDYGSDILRLWATSIDYQDDVRISDDILKTISESYRKIRNTIRFMISNTVDFNKNDAIKIHNLISYDKYMVFKFNKLKKEVINNYNNYKFSEIFKKINNFIVNDLSANYLDYAKDILYIDKPNSFSRRSIQTAINEILIGLIKLLAPIIPHTTEEIWEFLKNENSIHLEKFKTKTDKLEDKELEKKIDKLLEFKEKVNKEIEIKRNKNIIGKSLEAKLIINSNDELFNNLDFDLDKFFLVSQIRIEKGDEKITIEKASGKVCQRCWRTKTDVKNDICQRCHEIIEY